MRINVLQNVSEGKNEFEIRYNDRLQYIARLPFISVNEPLNLEKIRAIMVFDPNGNQIYTTNYHYAENLKEQVIPFKYLATGSQKFNQLLFISNQNTIKIYYEQNGIWNNRYVIEIYGRRFFCYSIEDGYIRHFPIYDELTGVQVGEALKSNIVIDGRDEYCCYLKQGYENLSDGIVALLLYLDRSEYSSSYIANKSYDLSKRYSYNKTNKFYDKNWVKNNFGDEYYRKVDSDVRLVREKLRHPVQTSREQYNSMSSGNKKLLKFVLLAPWVMIIVTALIMLIIFLVQTKG